MRCKYIGLGQGLLIEMLLDHNHNKIMIIIVLFSWQKKPTQAHLKSKMHCKNITDVLGRWFAYWWLDNKQECRNDGSWMIIEIFEGVWPF